MKELGNLAVVCAGRMDILLQIYDGYVLMEQVETSEYSKACVGGK